MVPFLDFLIILKNLLKQWHIADSDFFTIFGA